MNSSIKLRNNRQFHLFIHISPTETIVRSNNIEQNKNNQSYTHSNISESISTIVNKLSLLLLIEYVNSN